MRTGAQATKIAELTGGVHLPVSSDRNGRVRLSRCLDVGDADSYRQKVESVSALFKLRYNGDCVLVAIPSGWSATGSKVDLEWPLGTERVSLIQSHCCARRKACNWALAKMKDDMDTNNINTRSEDPKHKTVPLSLQVKQDRASHVLSLPPKLQRSDIREPRGHLQLDSRQHNEQRT